MYEMHNQYNTILSKISSLLILIYNAMFLIDYLILLLMIFPILNIMFIFQSVKHLTYVFNYYILLIITYLIF